MQSKRQASQKPALISPGVSRGAYTWQDSKFPIPEICTNRDLEEHEESFGLSNVTVYNIGFGAAKRKSLDWNCDLPASARHC